MFGFSKWIRPEYLSTGDTVALISPATKVKHEYVEGAVKYMESIGLRPIVMPGCDSTPSGSFAATLRHRLSDFEMALRSSDVKCIFCCRGGYGVQQLLPFVSVDEVRKNPKWIVGFSDISAFHAAWAEAKVYSLHAPMAKHIATKGNDLYTKATFDLLCGRETDYRVKVAADPLNVSGKATGRLLGGNLAVLNGLAATKFDIFNERDADDYIFFIEDVGENIYEIDRILTRLFMTGALNKMKALIVGDFTDYAPDLNYASMNEMISSRLSVMGVDIPVAFGFPIGHGDRNMPMMCGAEVKLKVDANGSELSFKL